jgi:hypothetical protein
MIALARLCRRRSNRSLTIGVPSGLAAAGTQCATRRLTYAHALDGAHAHARAHARAHAHACAHARARAWLCCLPVRHGPYSLSKLWAAVNELRLDGE